MGWSGLEKAVEHTKLGAAGLHGLKGTAVGHVTNPLGSSWVGIVFGLGFVLSFSYFTTNFAEVQRAMSAKSLTAGRRTPLIGAFPKIFIPAITVIPGLVALVTIKGLGAKSRALQYNDVIPLLMNEFLPTGILGVALTGLMASFMAGVAANLSAFNTVVTYDILEPYIAPGRSDAFYLRFGRLVTVGGIVVAIGTALIASGYSNLMNYIQALFSIFNAPIFATFIIGMFWKRMTPAAGFWGIVAGTTSALASWILYKAGALSFGSALSESFWGAGIGFAVNAIVSTAVTLVTAPKPVQELQGLVYGMANTQDAVSAEDRVWWRSPGLMAAVALGLAGVLTIIFY